MKTFAFVFARGGSKGIPDKNIRDFAGMPLLGYSLKIASETPGIDRCFVSTESAKIADIARFYGATVIPRPPELATDESNEWLAWQHAVDWVLSQGLGFDRFVSIPATSPLREVIDVSACLESLKSDVDMVVTMTPAQRSPWFNMVKVDESGFVNVLVDGDAGGVIRRQDAPMAFDLTTVAYVTRPEFILSNDSFWDGRVFGVTIPNERAIDIDTQFDFKIAEYLMQERVEGTGRSC